MSFRVLVLDTFCQVFRTFWSRKCLFLALATTAQFPLVLVGLISPLLIPKIIATFPSLLRYVQYAAGDFRQSESLLQLAADLMGLALGGAALNALLSCIGRGAIIRATAELFVDKDPRFFPCVGHGKNNSFSLFWASLPILFTVGASKVALIVAFSLIGTQTWLVGGILLLVTLAVYVCFRLIFVYSVVMVEGANVFGGIKRAWDLTSGFICGLFSAFLPFLFLQLVVFLAMNMFLPPRATSPWSQALTAAFLILLEILFFSFYAILGTTLYFKCRWFKEGTNKEELDLQLTANSSGDADQVALLERGDKQLNETVANVAQLLV